MFGFEESCGYLKGTYARDKDAIVASMLTCEMAASLKQQGKTILDALHELYARFGLYLSHVRSIELKGADAMDQAAEMMKKLRANTPSKVAGLPVTVVDDYLPGISRDMVTGAETKIDLPSSNVLELVLGGHGSVIARPSGTEPKVKFYYTAVGTTTEEAQALLEAMEKEIP